MKILVLGCGMQGKAVLHDFSKTDEVQEILCADYAPESLDSFREFLDMKKIELVKVDASNKDALISLMKQEIDVVVDVFPVKFIKNVLEAAIASGVNLVNTNYAYTVSHLQQQAMRRGISIMPECGLDPGIDLVIYGHAVKAFDELHVLNSYCGGFPEKRACDNPLNYKISWSWEGVLKSQKREAVFIKEGKKVMIPPSRQHDNEMVHEIDFPGLGRLEAFPNGDAVFFTDLLGVTKTLRETGRYSLRWPGWCAFWRPLVKLNFLSDDPVAGLPGEATPHQFMVKLMEPQLQYRQDEKDLAVMRNVFIGLKDGKKKKMTCDLLIERDLKTGLLAMSLGVGYAASIVAQMIGKGEIKRRGILSPATDVPYDLFMKRLRERGIKIAEKIEFES